MPSDTLSADPAEFALWVIIEPFSARVCPSLSLVGLGTQQDTQSDRSDHRLPVRRGRVHPFLQEAVRREQGHCEGQGLPWGWLVLSLLVSGDMKGNVCHLRVGVPLSCRVAYLALFLWRRIIFKVCSVTTDTFFV